MKPRRRLWWSSASLLTLLTATPLAAVNQPIINVTTDDLVELLVVISVNGASGGEPVTLLKGRNYTFYVATRCWSPADSRAPRLRPSFEAA